MNLYTVRELSEIELNLMYATQLAHGTFGHNAMMLNAKLADRLGFSYAPETGLDIGPNDIVAGIEFVTPDGHTAFTGGEDVREIY